MQLWRTVLCSAVIGGISLTATAQNDQPGAGGGGNQPAGERPARGTPTRQMGGGARLSPEKAKAAWELQATGVSKHLGLDAEKTKGVVKAYTEARESYTASATKMRDEMMQKMRDGGGGADARAEMTKAMEDLNSQERGKLEKGLTGAGLTTDQAAKALASLGTFNGGWDVMADAIAGFGLDDAKKQDVLNAVEEYVVNVGKAPATDMEARRTAMQEGRTKLTESLKKHLSDDQIAKIEAGMGMGGRGGMGGGPGGRGGDGERRGGGGGNGGGGK